MNDLLGAWRRLKPRVIKIGAILLGIVLLVSLTGPGRRFWRWAYDAVGFSDTIKAPLEVRYLNVGKADAILISCEGHLAMLDAGTLTGGETASDYIRRCRLGEELEYVIVSHPDSDHMDGIADVMEQIPVGTFLRGADYEESYAPFGEMLSEHSIPTRLLSPGETFSLGSAVFEVLGPVASYSETNNASLVLRLTYQGVSFLFCGDIERKAEADLVESGLDLSADVLKAAHHGSKTSSTEAFLEAVSPSITVVSTGYDSNGLPDEEALIRLEAHCQELYRTDVDGTVIVSVEDGEIRVRTEREGNGS